MSFLFGRKSSAAEVTPADVERRRGAGEQLFLLDVREPQEYAEARVAGSVLIPLGQLALRSGELPRDVPIIAICRSGNRSGVATGMLKQAGFNVVNMTGGVIAWARSGLPLERGRQ